MTIPYPNSPAAPRRRRTKPAVCRALRSICLCGALVLLPGAGWAQEADVASADAPVVERVEVQGNQYLAPETFLFYVSTKPGHRFDENVLKGDFRRLWDTGFVDDLVLHVFDGPQGGKIVIFRVSERKRKMLFV